MENSSKFFKHFIAFFLLQSGFLCLFDYVSDGDINWISILLQGLVYGLVMAIIFTRFSKTETAD